MQMDGIRAQLKVFTDEVWLEVFWFEAEGYAADRFTGQGAFSAISLIAGAKGACLVKNRRKTRG